MSRGQNPQGAYSFNKGYNSQSNMIPYHGTICCGLLIYNDVGHMDTYKTPRLSEPLALTQDCRSSRSLVLRHRPEVLPFSMICCDDVPLALFQNLSELMLECRLCGKFLMVNGCLVGPRNEAGAALEAASLARNCLSYTGLNRDDPSLPTRIPNELIQTSDGSRSQLFETG